MTARDRPPAVDRVEDITAAWLSAALSRPRYPAVDVVDVRAERIGTGQMGATYRLDITYGDGGGGPGPLVAKLPAEDPATRAAIADSYRKEVTFYTEVAPTLRVRAPRCFYGALGDDGTTFTLLLEDASPAEPGVQADGCTVAQATAAVRNLVGLHAPRWSDPSLLDVPIFDALTPEVADFLGSVHLGATDQFVERYREVLDPGDVATLRASAAATAAWLVARPTPYAVTHGDYRLDNLLFHPDGSVTAVDWQTAGLGHPLRDVAYLLGTSLDVEDRRAHERDLVGRYHDELVADGVEGYAADRCFEDYRLGHLQGPLVTVLGSEYATAERTPAGDAMFLAMARRSCAAIRDLGTLDLVG